MTLHTRAAVLRAASQPLSIERLELTGPVSGEVLIRVAACGVCRSDHHVMTGDTRHPLPVVCGHEGAGVVEAVGPGVSRVSSGDHVVLSWTPSCGRCWYCLRGKPNLCEAFTGPLWAGTMMDGTTRFRDRGTPVYHYCGLAAFSERIVVPENACIPIERDIPLTAAALIGCAVATGVGAVLYTARVAPGDSVVVLGAGGVGLNILQGAALAGAGTILAADSAPHKAETARRFGATEVLGMDGLPDAVRSRTGGRGADYAFEAVGATHLQEVALDCVRPGGTVILAGLTPMGSATNLPGAVLTRTEKTVKGSYYGSVHPERDFPAFLDLYRAGRLKLDELVSATYPLDRINEAFDIMMSGRHARGLIVFPDTA